MEGIGWISLHRQLFENPLWLEEKFTRGQAWVDLLLLANHKDGTVRKRGIKFTVHRGEVGWSQRALAKRWKWSREKMSNFMGELKTEKMVEIYPAKTGPQTGPQIGNVTSLIHIVNYDKYQSDRTTEQTTDRTTDRAMNNNEKKEPLNIALEEPKTKTPKPDPTPHAEVVDYLNAATGKSYRVGEATKKLIRARFAEGHTLEDFKRVVDNKVATWKGDPEWEKFLRPETLFGNKFDGYRNEVTKRKPVSFREIQQDKFRY